MSWHYSQALVAEYSAANCSDGAPSAPLNGSPIPQVFLSPDRMKAFSRLSQFGMTFAPLTENLGEAVLTWFLAGFPAKTSHPQVKALELTERVAECGRTWPESFTKWDRATSSWKTPLCLLSEDCIEFLGTWPRWGTMRNGECWALTTPGLLINETASGFSQNWPTPRSCSAMAATITLESAWNVKRHPNLETIVGRRMWPTPTCHNSREAGYPAEFTRNTPTLTSQAHGGKPIQPMSLNPVWVEWLMWWPLGWTSLKPLETDKFQQWQHSHGKF